MEFDLHESIREVLDGRSICFKTSKFAVGIVADILVAKHDFEEMDLCSDFDKNGWQCDMDLKMHRTVDGVRETFVISGCGFYGGVGFARED